VDEQRDIPWVLDRVIVFGLPIVVLTLLQRGGVLAWLNTTLERTSSSETLALVAVAVMVVPAWLVHSLGHALIARLLAGPVTVRVRASGVWVCARGDRSPATSAPLPITREVALDVLAIGLGGPAATLACALVSLSLLDGAGSNSGLVYACLWALAFLSLFWTLTLFPFRLRVRRRGPRMTSGGRLAMDALGVLWAAR
jgi:hypothetical protein